MCKKQNQHIFLAVLLHILIYLLFKMALPDLRDIFLPYNTRTLIALLFTLSSFVFWMHSVAITKNKSEYSYTERNVVFPKTSVSLWIVIIILIRVLIFVASTEKTSFDMWQEPKYIAVFWGDYGILELVNRKMSREK